MVNIPFPEMELVSDFVGSTTVRELDKWQETGLTPVPAVRVQPSLLAECQVHLDCQVILPVKLPSHTLFIAEVVALHVEKTVLDERGEVDLVQAKGGLKYGSTVVRERPVENFRPEALRARAQARRQQ